jgi:hypothetical protein
LRRNRITIPSRGGGSSNTMDNRTLLTTGIVGTIIAALCCFTPLLPMLSRALHSLSIDSAAAY